MMKPSVRVPGASRSRATQAPTAHMCRPRVFIRSRRFSPDISRRQGVPFSDATPSTSAQQTPRAFRRDPFLALAPFSPFLVNRLEHYLNELHGDFESIGKDIESYVNPDDVRLSIDIQEEDGAFLLKVDVPGMTKEDIKIKVTDERLLVISAERKSETSDEDDTTGFVRKERRFGKFSRSLRVPKSVNISGITAEVKDGVMTVTLPKNPQEQPKEQQIQIS